MSAQARLSSVVAIAITVAATPAVAQSGAEALGFGFLIAEQSRPSFSILGAGARAAGMGGAFTALADDASAASFNPAGLALLLSPEVSVVADGLRHQEEYTKFVPVVTPAGRAYDDTQIDYTTTSLNFAAFTLPFKVSERNLCFQLSYQRLIDFTYEADREFFQRDGTTPVLGFEQSVRQSGEIQTFSLAVAYQLTQRLSLGATLSRWDGAWTFSTYDLSRELATARDAYVTYSQENEVEGWSWSVGALLRYQYINVGGIYRFGFDADYTFASTLDTNIPTAIPAEVPLSTQLHWPSSWTLGIAIKPTDTWHITADYARYNWSAMEILGLGESGRVAVNFFDLEPAATTTTSDVHQWRFGTEYTYFAGTVPLALRAGYFRDKQPAKMLEASQSEWIAGYSGGLGVKLGQFSIDLAYQHRSWTAKVAQFVDPRVIETGDVKRIAVGDKTTTDDRVYLALLYQFPSSKGVNGVLHWLFVGPDEPEGGGGS
jgi:long-subunit fatty acid transport protein